MSVKGRERVCYHVRERGRDKEKKMALGEYISLGLTKEEIEFRNKFKILFVAEGVAHGVAIAKSLK